MTLPIKIDIDSRAVRKIIELVRDFAEPGLIRRKALALGEAKLTEAKDDEAVREFRRDRKRANTLANRTARRVDLLEQQRQANMESMILHALAEAPPESEAHDVDPDWLAAYFENGKDVSNQEMQSL